MESTMCKHYKPGDCFQYKAGVVLQCGDCEDFEPIDVDDNTESGYDAANAITESLSSSFISTVQTESPAEANAEASEKVEDDAVNHPSHYCQGGIECIDCIKAALGENYIGFLIGNVIKYAYRYKDKDGVRDLRKASVYLNWAIKELETDA